MEVCTNAHNEHMLCVCVRTQVSSHSPVPGYMWSSLGADLALQLICLCPLLRLLSQHMNQCHGRMCDGLVDGIGTSEDLKEGQFGEG